MGATSYLIDSSALLYAMVSPRSLSVKARKIITSMDETLYASAASLEWDHGDPFDRLIAAQALIEGAPVITSDSTMHRYEPLSTLW